MTKIIKTKEDFKGKCFIVPEDLTEEKYDKIRQKFSEMYIHEYCRNLTFDDIEKGFVFFSENEDRIIGNYKKEHFSSAGYVKSLEKITIEDFLREEEVEIIKTKEDFKGKYIELPEDIIEETFKKIQNKFTRLGFYVSFYWPHSESSNHFVRIETIGNNAGCVGTFSYDQSPELHKISIEDFLREEGDFETEEQIQNGFTPEMIAILEKKIGRQNSDDIRKQINRMTNQEIERKSDCKKCKKCKADLGDDDFFCWSCGFDLKQKKFPWDCDYKIKKEVVKKEKIWSADEILLNENIPLNEIGEFYYYGLKREFYKTKERAELERDRREVDYLMKKMACESRDDNDWRREKPDGVDKHTICFKDMFVIQSLNTWIFFNQTFFNTEEKAQYCLDHLLKTYGKERLKEIWGVK